MVAAWQGHEQCVSLVLQHDTATATSTVNMQMTDFDAEFQLSAGSTALMVAARHGKAACAKLLVDAGADAGIANAEGKTAVVLAEESGHADIATMLRSD